MAVWSRSESPQALPPAHDAPRPAPSFPANIAARPLADWPLRRYRQTHRHRQFSCLPTAAILSCHPTECVPFFTNPVSSRPKPLPALSPSSRQGVFSNPPQHRSSLQGASATTWCSDCGPPHAVRSQTSLPSVPHSCAPGKQQARAISLQRFFRSACPAACARPSK